MYNYMYIKLCMNKFFYIFPNYFFQLFFFLKRTMQKLIPFNYFLYFHITVIISITPKNNFTKERGIYEHAWIYFIHDYTFMNIYVCLYIFIHINV